MEECQCGALTETAHDGRGPNEVYYEDRAGHCGQAIVGVSAVNEDAQRAPTHGLDAASLTLWRPQREGRVRTTE